MPDQLRDQLSTRLNAAFTAGTIDGDDFQARLDHPLRARSGWANWCPVVEGLPPLQTYADPAIVASVGGQPGELAAAPRRRASWPW